MKTLNFFNVGLAMFTGLAVMSCDQDEAKVTASDTSEVVSESLTDAYFEDVDDMILTAIEDENSPTGGRKTSDERFCLGLSFDGTAASGVIVLDFGIGCTDYGGNVRTGKITMNYSGGPGGSTGFTVVASLQDYTINGVQLMGTRTIKRLASTNASVVRHEITLQNGKAIWPDGTEATRQSSFIREVDLLALTVRLSGEASGTNRRGKDYAMMIVEDLIYKASCVAADGIYLAVEGVKTFNSSGRTLTIDYGTGVCDRSVTVNIDNASASVTVGG